MKGQQFFVLLFFVFLSFFVIGAPTAFGHSFVIQETPSPNSQLETSPAEIVITFNNKVEKELFSIKVLDEKQQEVTSNKAFINDRQLEIRLTLPDLVDGVYQVQYRAISSNDGHLMEGSYYFQVATTTPANQLIDNENQHTQPTLQAVDSTATHHETSTLNGHGDFEWIIYFMRALFYIGLLLIVGWIFWWRTVQDYSTEVKKSIELLVWPYKCFT